MTNIPLTNMAISLSGGGYRATTFHLGAMCLLDAIQLEAGNKLIVDEKRREKGITLLENVRIISTISGGTLTGVMYALKLSQKGNFKDCYYSLYELLKDDKLVDHALDKLNSPGTWANKYKNRNLINSFAEVYNEHFYEGATFGDLYNDLDSHLTDAIFGASEFTAGLQYRFLQSGSGEFGGGTLQLPKEVAERIRLADAAASSSCFPGGFEPMTMPTDFSNGPESRVEEWWRKKKINFEREATLAIYKANEAAGAAEEAASRDITLATSISETFKKFTAADEELKLIARKEEKAIKAHAKASKALTEATETSRDAALKKVDKTRTEVAEIRTAKVAAREAIEIASVAKSEVLQQHPELATLILAAHEANLNAAATTAAAEDALTTAVKSVRSAERAVNKASGKAQKDRENAEFAQAAVRDSADLSAALKRAEKAATRAEKSAEAVNVKASAVIETSADLALILAEKVVELTRRTQRLATSVLSAKDKATVLEKAGSLALQAEKVAGESVTAAKSAKAAVVYATGQLNSCSYVISLAEDTSTQVASYKVNNPEATAYGELKTGMAKNRNMAVKAKSRSLTTKWTKGGPVKEGGNKMIPDSTSLNIQANTTENPTERAIYGTVGDVTDTAAPDNTTQSPIPLDYGISPANQAVTTARKIEKEALLARKKAAVSAAENVISVTKETLAKIQNATHVLLDKPAKFSEALTDAISAATKATAEAQKAEEKAVLARKETPYHPTTAIMDGGILDNQGIRGVVMAEKRHSKDGKKPPFIGTYIISDVSGETMSPYTFPGFTHSAFANFFTLKKLILPRLS
ncbi:hypothetical protein CEQ90_17095 [Lewinellaceae bacterium SD302]|nr:hypothetical protein CEQ90_17095 [Lewinellaceae bacterium SD302]